MATGINHAKGVVIVTTFFCIKKDPQIALEVFKEGGGLLMTVHLHNCNAVQMATGINHAKGVVIVTTFFCIKKDPQIALEVFKEGGGLLSHLM